MCSIIVLHEILHDTLQIVTAIEGLELEIRCQGFCGSILLPVFYICELGIGTSGSYWIKTLWSACLNTCHHRTCSGSIVTDSTGITSIGIVLAHTEIHSVYHYSGGRSL